MLSGCLATHHFPLTLLSPEISIVYSSDKSPKIETFVLAVALQSVFGHVVQLIGSKMLTNVLVYNPFFFHSPSILERGTQQLYLLIS